MARHGKARALAALLVFATVFQLANLALALAGEPILQTFGGNPTCGALDGSWAEVVRVDPVTGGNHGPVQVTITVSNGDPKIFSWTSTLPITAVFAKGGNGGNLYTYAPAATAGSGLHAPANKKGNLAGLSHISFCVSAAAPTTTTTTTVAQPTTTTTVVQPTTTTTVVQPTTTTTVVQPTTTTTVAQPTTTTTVAQPTTTTTVVQPTTTTTVLLGGIGDYVWLDVDGNGMQDAGEEPISGARVLLYDGNGNLVATEVTGADGYYYFDGLAGGDYFVEFLSPVESYAFTEALAGDSELDSNAQPSSTMVSLAPGEQNLTIDAGLVVRASSIVIEVLPTQLVPTAAPQVLPSTGLTLDQLLAVALTLLAFGVGLLRLRDYARPEVEERS